MVRLIMPILCLFITVFAFGQNEVKESLDKIVSAYDINIIYDISELKDAKINKIKIGKSSAEQDIEATLKDSELEYKQLTSKTFIIRRKDAEIEKI